MNFEDLKIITPLKRALAIEKYTMATPIQEKTIPLILDGQDVIGCAQTGTGKTAAFAIPLLQILYNHQTVEKGSRKIKAVILVPTRELAVQIGDSLTGFSRYTDIKHVVIYGGISQVPQVNSLKSGVDIIVATPGRLLDLIDQGHINLSFLRMLVLDEADHMLDLGFYRDLKRIIALLPVIRQTVLFSATMPSAILKLAASMQRNSVRVDITPASSTVDSIEQSVYFVEQNHKERLLIKLLNNSRLDSVLVFTRTKRGADKVVRSLVKERISAQSIHGDKSQSDRQRALNNFKAKRTRVLVATDVASRGIDVQELSHVINYDLPNVPETYVHRIGRTGRAGKCGVALSFCNMEEKSCLRNIQKLISKHIQIVS